MNWDAVEKNIVFWSDENQWKTDPGREVKAFQAAEEKKILGYLKNLYVNSKYVQKLLEKGILEDQKINIGHSDDYHGFAYPRETGFNYVGINLNRINDLYIINSNGALVKYKPDIVIAHELIHNIMNLYDPKEEAPRNSVNFDYRGDTVRAENIIAKQMGYDTQERINYFATIDSKMQTKLFDAFSKNTSYSLGNEIDIARIATVKADILDTSVRTDNSSDLLFGIAGNNTLKGGAGDDYLYGGSGNDILDGGEDNDYIIGDKGNDTIYGSAGEDVIDGGAGYDTLDYSALDERVYVNVEGGQTVTNVEKVIGAANHHNILSWSEGIQELHGGSQSDSLTGGEGEDVLLYGGGGQDIFNLTANTFVMDAEDGGAAHGDFITWGPYLLSGGGRPL